MAGAKQADGSGIIELAQAIETHGIQALQREPFPVVEAQRHIDGLDQFQIRERRDERLRLLEAGVKFTENALNRTQGVPRLSRLIEQELAFVLAESRVVAIDRNMPVGQEEAFTLQ